MNICVRLDKGLQMPVYLAAVPVLWGAEPYLIGFGCKATIAFHFSSVRKPSCGQKSRSKLGLKNVF